MALEKGEPIKTGGKKIVLNFDLWVRNENVFGTIFRVITNDNANIDLIYSVNKNDDRMPILVVQDKVHFIKKQIRRETWVNVSLTIDPVVGEIKLNYDGADANISHSGLKGVKSVRIAFGFCPFEGFGLSDVASVNIRNVGLKKDDRSIRYWKMDQHDGDICYDELYKIPAVGKNTRWIIDQYITWQKICEKEFKTHPSITFDSVNNDFYLATDNKVLFVFNSQKKTTDTLRVKGGDYVGKFPNQLIYLPGDKKLLSYNLDENTYSVFNFIANTWEGDKASLKEHDYWNNALLYYPKDSALISFGGYGHYLYNNKLLISFPFHKNRPQESAILPDIQPRYAPASAIIGNILYVFGGRGSPSGHQELSPRNYYDFYSVDLSTKKVHLLWEIKDNPENGSFIPGENMIYDAEKGSFYAFTTQQGGKLIKINTVQPGFEVMSKPIGLNIGAQYLYTNLYLSTVTKKLYAAIILSAVDGKSKLEIYQIDYPPISIKEVGQNGDISFATRTKNLNRPVIVITIIVLCAVIFIILFYRKYISSKGQRVMAAEKKSEGNAANNLVVLPLESLVSEDVPYKPRYDFSKKCICFLGGFRAVDQKGNDMSSFFSPTLKSLLILIILFTGKDVRGISGNKIIQLLWNDKTDESAKNNRNVYISKLRGLLEEIGEVKILNQNGFWRIQIEDDAFCDYLETIKMFNKKDKEDLEKLLELLLQGEILPEIHLDWLDTFKSDFSSTAIDLLSHLLKNGNLTDDQQLTIADAIFKYDFLSEEALQTKCSVLHKQGKYGLAKTIYDNFSNEYLLSLGINYKCSFVDVIERKCEDNMN